MSAPVLGRATFRAALVGLLILGTIVLTTFVHEPTGLDTSWRAWLIERRSRTLDAVLATISTMGSSLVLTPVAVVLAMVLAMRGHRSDALLVSLTTLGAVLLGPLLKTVIERPRPDHGHLVVVNSWAYPSGHSLTSMAVLGVLIALAVRHLSALSARTVVIAAGVLLIVAVGVSRVYLGVHWPTDVLAGWLIGSTWLALCLFLCTRNSRRARPDAATTESGTAAVEQPDEVGRADDRGHQARRQLGRGDHTAADQVRRAHQRRSE
jgi:membrane-associated phospholipid phosphatase